MVVTMTSPERWEVEQHTDHDADTDHQRMDDIERQPKDLGDRYPGCRCNVGEGSKGMDDRPRQGNGIPKDPWYVEEHEHREQRDGDEQYRTDQATLEQEGAERGLLPGRDAGCEQDEQRCHHVE